MHNVNIDAVEQTAAKAKIDPAAVTQHTTFDGEWQTETGRPQFRATIPVPSGDPVVFEAGYPPHMGEAARRGVELRALRARVEADVDQSRALGVTDNLPVQRIDWHLDVDADAASPAFTKSASMSVGGTD